MEDHIEIQGMSCEHCVTAVRQALESLDGVEVQQVKIGSARIRIEDGTASSGDVDEAIKDAGYVPVSHTNGAGAE